MGRFYKPAQQQTPIDYMSKLPEELLINTLNVVEGRIDAADNVLAEDLAMLKFTPRKGKDEELYKQKMEKINTQIEDLTEKYHKDPMNFYKYKYDLVKLRKEIKEDWEKGDLYKMKQQSDLYQSGIKKIMDMKDSPLRDQAIARYKVQEEEQGYKSYSETPRTESDFWDLPKLDLSKYESAINSFEKDSSTSTKKYPDGYFDKSYTNTFTKLDQQRLLATLYEMNMEDLDNTKYYMNLQQAGLTPKGFDAKKQGFVNKYQSPNGGVYYQLNSNHPDYGRINSLIQQNSGSTITSISDVNLSAPYLAAIKENTKVNINKLTNDIPILVYPNGTKKALTTNQMIDEYLAVDLKGNIIPQGKYSNATISWLPVSQFKIQNPMLEFEAKENINNTEIGRLLIGYQADPNRLLKREEEFLKQQEGQKKQTKAFGGTIYANGGIVDDPPSFDMTLFNKRNEEEDKIANQKLLGTYKKPTTSKTDNAGSGSLDAPSYRETGFHFFYNPMNKPKDLSEVMKDYKATKDALEIEESKGKVNQSTLEALAERGQDVLAIRETVKNFFPNSKDFDDKWDLFYNNMVGEKDNFYNSPERIIKYGTKKSDVLKTWSEKGFTYDDSKYVAMAISMDKETFVADFENMLEQTERTIFEKAKGNISDLIVIDEETGETYYSPKFLKIASNMLESIVDGNYSIGQGNTTRQRLYESALNFSKDLLSKNEQNEQKQIYPIAEKFKTVESVNKINKIKIPELLLNEDFYSYVAEPVITTIEDTKYPIEADDIKIYDFITDEETKRTFRGSNFDVENLRNTYGKNFSDIFDFVSVGYDEDGLYLVGKMKQSRNEKQKTVSTFERIADFMNSINPVTPGPSMFRNIPTTNYPTQYKFVINNPAMKKDILIALENRVDKVAKRDAEQIANNPTTLEDVTSLINIIKYPNIYSLLQKTLQDMIYSGSKGMVSDFDQVKSFSFRSDDGKETYNFMVSPVEVDGKTEYKIKGQTMDGSYFPIETYIGKQADGEEIYKDSYINTETMLNAIVNTIFPPKQENKK